MTRKPDGTFAPGNPGGPGRPRRQTEAAYLVALSDAVTVEDWQEIVKVAVIAAKSGDAAARKWLGDYLLGVNPPQAERPTLARAHALTLAQELGGDGQLPPDEVLEELDELNVERKRSQQARELQKLINGD